MGKTNSEIYGSSTLFSSRPFKNLLPKAKQKVGRVSGSRSNIGIDAENIPPADPNIQIQGSLHSASKLFTKRSQPKATNGPLMEGEKTPLEPDRATESLDPSVKVFVRVKPVKSVAFTDKSFGNVTKQTLSVAGKNYAFDSVFDANSTQEDVYQRVGAPLVKDALSGYNASIVAYGQTGSGKTYTLWGPPSSMVEGQTDIGLQGIVPRIFRDLFLELQNDKGNFNGKPSNYHCRCSFLEVYDEKICDLIDPTLRDLEIKDDPKNGVYVENLTEEYVSSYEDVAQILIKGLSHRKVGATSVNSKSSRSHIMFTCVIESWCKEESSMGFGTLRTSRISLVDLAGFERNLSDDSTRQDVKEIKYIKKSLSKLGFLVNVLAEANQSGKPSEVPYRSSCMSHLLKESFGGNAKLSLLCTVSPENKNFSETISTLRFGLLVRLMKNEPIENEIKEDEVNDLSDQIRRLKEELMLAKSSSCNSLGSSSNGYFKGGNEREILNKLRLSLSRSLILPCIEKDSEEDISFTEDDVKKLKLQICNLHSTHDGSLEEESENGENSLLYSAEGCHLGSNADVYLSCSEESDGEEIDSNDTLEMDEHDEAPKLKALRSLSLDTSSVSDFNQSADLQGPVLSESPTIKSSQKKSSELLMNHAANNSADHQVDTNQSSLRSSRIFAGSTDTLAASLQKGLEIINSHQKNSGLARSASFSFERLALKPCPLADRANTSVESSPCEGGGSLAKTSATLLCTRCQSRNSNETKQDIQTEEELRRTCEDQAAQIENLKRKIEELSSTHADLSTSRNSSNFSSIKNQKLETISENEPDSQLQTVVGDETRALESMVDKADEVNFPTDEKDALLKEIELLQNKLQFYTSAPTRRSSDKLRNSLLSQSLQLRKSFAAAPVNSREEFEKEREKWMEMESEWISLTDDLRIEIEHNRQRAEDSQQELAKEKQCVEELDDALKRSVMGHARLVEHYTELQENYNDMLVKYRSMMEWLAEVKKAACKAGATGRRGTRLAKALTSELSAARAQREHERTLLRKENKSLRIQLKDTAEAVHAAGELLVRLRQAEEAASEAEEQQRYMKEDNEKMRKQIENLKQKHKIEMSTMKQYLAESRLPEAALRPPIYSDDTITVAPHNEDQAWRAEFGAIYQEHY